MSHLTYENVQAALEHLKRFNQAFKDGDADSMSSARTSMEAIVQPIINLLGAITNSFIFVSLMTPNNPSRDVWSVGLSNWSLAPFLEEPEGRQVMSTLQRFYINNPNRDSSSDGVVSLSTRYAPGFRPLICSAARSMLPELLQYTAMAEQYDAIGLRTSLQNGIFDDKYPRPSTWPSYIPVSFPCWVELMSWFTAPMPEAFISSTTPSSHPDSADNLLLMISSRPFVDPKSGWLLQGSGGVSFAIYLLLRLIFTGRYLVDYPSVFNFPFNQTTAIQKTRTVARACTALLICDIDTSLERARRVTQSVRHSNELRFVPYPQPVPQACLPAGPSCGSSSGIGLESTTVHKTADTRAKLKAKQAIELLRGVDANDPTNVGLWDNGNQRSDRQKVYMEAPWLIFFKEHYEKAGKSLPNHLQAVVQNSLKRRIQVDPSCSVENIAGKTNRLQIGHNLPSSRSTKLSNLLEGKRHVSGGSDTHPERKRTKGGANSPSEIVEYIVVSDSDSE